MNVLCPTSVVRLTPPGRGALATVLVQGPRATELVASRFWPARGGHLGDCPFDSPIFGRWGKPDGEEVVVCRQAADRIDIHCHGGTAAAGALIDALTEVGGRRLPWTEWLANNEMDPIRAAARGALAAARCVAAAAVLLDQYQGAFRRGLDAVEKAIRNADLSRAAADLDTMLRHAPLGLHLVQPWRVVLAGPPNAGKSTLLNALLGFPRAIVNQQPGTTRDALTADTALGGWPVELIDTAGLGSPRDTFEAAAVARAERELETADAIVLIFDVSRPATPLDKALHAAWPAAIRVDNKCDLARKRDLEPGVHRVSAKFGTGIDDLAVAIAHRLVPGTPPPGAAVPFLARHVEALTAARDALRQGDRTSALRKLNRITRPPIRSGRCSAWGCHDGGPALA